MNYPKYHDRDVIALNGVWDFKFCENFDFACNDIAKIKYDDKISVPSAFDAMPAYNGLRGTGFYKRSIEIHPGKKAKICFGAVGMYCKVFIDNHPVGSHYSAYTPFECEVPVSDRRERELVVMACNRFDFDKYCLHEIYFDFYAYGGIFRDVTLQILPEGYLIDGIKVDTIDHLSGRIAVRVETGSGKRLAVKIDQASFGEFPGADKAGGPACFELSVKNPTPWSTAAPDLHTLTVDNGVEAVTVRFGLRTVRAENGQIILNDKPVKLLGYCRHEAHPQYGPALPLQQLIADLQLLRDQGCNFVRGSHYPQDPRFLDLCDEMGIMVFEESMGWGQSAKRHFTSKRFVDEQIKQTKEMIDASYNHPSIILRGFLNEGETDSTDAGECYKDLAKFIRKEDPGRLVTYATNRELRDLFLEEVDVVSFNIYPGWYTDDMDNETPFDEISRRIDDSLFGLKKRNLSDKPFLISEIGAGAIYGWRDAICAHWSEEYQNEYLRQVCNKVIGDDRVAGVALWQFCDCRTYRGAHALGRPRAFNNKGVLDEYRRPKIAYATVKEAFRGYFDSASDKKDATSK